MLERICKRCGNAIFDGGKDGRCKNCRGSRTKRKLKELAIGLGAGTAAILLAALASKGKKDEHHDYDDDYDYDYDDEDSGEKISVWDAADIYMCSGFDEDYRIGYTHEELMQALGK